MSFQFQQFSFRDGYEVASRIKGEFDSIREYKIECKTDIKTTYGGVDRMDNNMLVKDMIKAIDNKKLKIVDLCDQFGFSDRTIQKKIRKLGFEWDSKAGKYSFTGTDKTVFDKAISEVFKNNIRNASRLNSQSNIKSEVEKEVKIANEEVASTVQTANKRTVKKDSESTPEITNNIASTRNIKSNRNNVNKRNVKKTNKQDIDKTSDNIDLLLAGKKAKKEFRGFYLDSDVASVIDSVNSGIKSELVSECLRKVFKEKGLL